MAAGTFYTIGHSTRPLAELVDMLKANGVKLLVDVRTVPKSRTNPQFNREALEQQLESEYGIKYLWLGKELGGLRKRDKSSEANAGWDNASFRGYADYMQTDGFRQGLQQPCSGAHSSPPSSPQPAAAATVRRQGHRRNSFGPDDPLQKHSYSTTLAYGNSKLAQILFTAELNRRLSAGGVPVDALCLHPGNVLTEVVRSLPPLIQRLYRATLTHVLFTPQEGSRATVFAATDPAAPQLAASIGSYLDAHAEPAQPSRRAGDKQLAAWVWDWSKGQVQLPDAWDVAAA